MLIPRHLFAQEEYGLQFASKGMDPDARTGMNVFPDQPFKAGNQFSLAFDISFIPNSGSYFGYIFRLTDEKDQHIDLVYNVRTAALEIIAGDDYTGISIKTPPDTFISQWQHLRLRVDKVPSALTFEMNGRVVGKAPLRSAVGGKWRLSFGANRYGRDKTFDLAPMRLRDLKIFKENELTYHWPLRQSTGHTATDVRQHQVAVIDHPIWLAYVYRNWEQTGAFTTMGNASVAFDKEKGTVYICARDSLFRYDVNKDILYVDSLSKTQGLPAGNQSVYGRNALYNFLPDLKTVTTYDETKHAWDMQVDNDSVTKYWHANRFYAPFDSAIYVIGGYGNYRYTNEVQRYRVSTHKWEDVQTSGDTYTPRYQAALGTTENGDSAYIIGGYGSINGDQLLNPHHLYDLHLFDARTGAFRKIYELPVPEHPFAFGNTMVIDTKEKSFYALTFDNDKMESSLQLIRGSLTRPVYTRLATPIPFRYFDIRARAELFYYEKAQRLVVVTLFTPQNHVTQVRLYTILFPPALLASPDTPGPRSHWLLWGAISASVLVTIGWLFRRKRTVASPLAVPVIHTNALPSSGPAIPVNITPEPAAMPMASPAPGATIFLFGHFTVLDKDGNNITRLFSPLVKELFLLLLLHSIPDRKGITSDKINETLWPGRSGKDARNNRSVNIVKLKNVLDKLGHYTLEKDGDKWLLNFDPGQVKIDLLQYFASAGQIADQLVFTARGGLLTETEYSWLDKFKSEFSTSITTHFLQHLQENTDKYPPELAIAIANSILNFDALSEEAVMFKCRALVVLKQHASARAIYNSFKKEYENIYGETFEKEYQALLVD
ncbi:kelch repeat-containing protein [Chitinophaga agri]|uniref:Galactose oxidase n=1 Tax=Chitinophaga agri TaxID=2703787 RepID=A0A6B9ZGM9_9BACT|nr:kelch repeat-containing protein [Chitinophaga agri]QHS60899.1 hypothetical protein GWR21_15240 [Chitinophaga agri]